MKGKTFPAPLEVDSFTKPVNPAPVVEKPEFSSPLEVDRYLYNKFDFKVTSTYKAFPAPLEVDRELYFGSPIRESTCTCFRPLSR